MKKKSFIECSEKCFHRTTRSWHAKKGAPDECGMGADYDGSNVGWRNVCANIFPFDLFFNETYFKNIKISVTFDLSTRTTLCWRVDEELEEKKINEYIRRWVTIAVTTVHTFTWKRFSKWNLYCRSPKLFITLIRTTRYSFNAFHDDGADGAKNVFDDPYETVAIVPMIEKLLQYTYFACVLSNDSKIWSRGKTEVFTLNYFCSHTCVQTKLLTDVSRDPCRTQIHELLLKFKLPFLCFVTHLYQ